MSSYTAPTQKQIEDWTGVNIGAVSLDEAELGTLISQLIVNAASEVAQIAGESRFDSSSLTARQAASLAEAVACGVASRFLVHPQVCRVTGTHRPLLTEGSQEMGEVADDLGRRSRALARLVANGPATAEAQVRSSSVEAGLAATDRKFQRTGDYW
jgi:hypothetical protein